VDLGLDRVVRYPDGLVIPTPPPGAGPRHLLFHPNGSLGFLLYELGNRLASFRLRADGSFEFLDAKPTLPPGDTGRGYNGDLAAAIRLSPDGRRVVVSNRGENSLLAFDFDPATGALATGARTLLLGSWPRDFLFVSDTLALAAMERSGEVLSLRYDPATGAFSLLSRLSGIFRPVALSRAVP
jgi:6-phosphogluconolactonase